MMPIKPPTWFLFFVAWISGCPTGDGDTAPVDYCADYDPSAPAPSDWVSISGGTFEMGSDDGEGVPGWEFMLDEQPVHSVSVQSFEIWRTEVTVVQYSTCYCEGSCNEPFLSTDEWTNWKVPGRENHPANTVHWEDAVVFCQWLGGRLPSESEWEYAARSQGQDIAYPWGHEEATCEYAVMNYGGWGCGYGYTQEVCSKPAGNTDQGLCDMSGNDLEWVRDTYHPSYTGAPADGSPWESGGTDHVVRGGDFSGSYEMLRATNRLGTDVPHAFRCAKDASLAASKN